MINDKMRQQGYGSRQMEDQQVEQFLSSQSYGTLMYHNDEQWPDGRVLNFGYLNGNLYFHAAKKCGEKLGHFSDGMKVCVSFYQPSALVGKQHRCEHESVLVYGYLYRLDDKQECQSEAKEAMKTICVQGNTAWKSEEPGFDKVLNGVAVFKVVIEYKVGKFTSFRSLPK